MATVLASAPSPHLSLNTTAHGTAAAVPHKHIPHCPPGPLPARGLQTPPASPPSDEHDQDHLQVSSLTYPPQACGTLFNVDPPLFTITAQRLSQAVEHVATQPLPDPAAVFPWLHGLHANNQLQLAFFTHRRKNSLAVPRCLRGLTVIKAGGDLSSSKLKGAIAPKELLPLEDDTFIECDPKDGFSVRNFQIQACKLATVSDIVVYRDASTSAADTMALATRISKAQRQHESRNGLRRGQFNTFVLSDSFQHVQTHHPELVAISSAGAAIGGVVDFFYWERHEMCQMSKTSEFSNNVFLGPSPDSTLDSTAIRNHFHVLIEASDVAHVPDSTWLQRSRNLVQRSSRRPMHLEFPSSGSIMLPSWSQVETDGLLDMCRWIHELANPERTKRGRFEEREQEDGSPDPGHARPRKILIHCADGYTETTLLAMAYFMYAEGLPVHEAWVQLHRDRKRNFFAYPTDVALLAAIQPRILQASPRFHGSVLHISDPQWMSQLDGSLPSRILPYMYLGNLGHANNPELLRELGITRILSVGESLSWSEAVRQKLRWPVNKLMTVDCVQDNGVDPLWGEFERCLKFIEAGKLEGGATLVHCRVGVSRSATICIAEVMNELGLSFPRAYCFVRARRLNVIIQPHLRFTYELLKWEEHQRVRRNQPLRRELEWATIAREIALMNKPYSR